jgi:hypothetical protein
MRPAPLLAFALLAAPILTHADTILVGTNLSSTNPAAAALCPSVGACDEVASQFTFSTAVVIDSISVVVSAPVLNFVSPSNFTIGLGSVLGPGVTTGIGAGNIVTTPGPGAPLITEEFTFSGLDIPLGPGTYYLGMAGGNVTWDYAQPLSTTAGTLGLQLYCVVDETCISDITKWNVNNPNTYAFEIDGTAVTPEPSTLALFGTGILGLPVWPVAGFYRNRNNRPLPKH